MDIHILTTNINNVNGSETVRVVYHVQVNEAKYPADDTRESEVPDLGTDFPAELTAIKGGGLTALFEYTENYPINVKRDPAEIANEIRARWHLVQSVADQELSERYKFYKQTLSRS